MLATFYYLDGHVSSSHDGSSNVIRIEWENGAVEYYKDGVLHREDELPALIHSDGSKEYWINGSRRPKNLGPAIEWADGTVVYEEDPIIE